MADFDTYHISDNDKRLLIGCAAINDVNEMNRILNVRYAGLNDDEKAAVKACAAEAREAQGDSRLSRIEAQMEADRARSMAIIGFIVGLGGLIGNFYTSFRAANKEHWFKSSSSDGVMVSVVIVFIIGMLSWAWVKSVTSLLLFKRMFGTSYEKFANWACRCVIEERLRQELIALVRRPFIYAIFIGLSFGSGDSEKSLIFIFCCIDGCLFFIDFFLMKGVRLVCCDPDYVNELSQHIEQRQQAQVQARARARVQSQLNIKLIEDEEENDQNNNDSNINSQYNNNNMDSKPQPSEQ